MTLIFSLILASLFYGVRNAYELSADSNIHHVSLKSPKDSTNLLKAANDGILSPEIANYTNAPGDTQPKSMTEEAMYRFYADSLKSREGTYNDFNITAVFWDDVWKSPNIKWVAKRVDSELRPSDRQFFHTLIPDTIFGLHDTCINLDQKDERDFTLLANISWKDKQPSLHYPAVPKQCAYGRSSGFLCILLDDGDSCHYVSGWGQDRVQALVDGRHSKCGHRQQLHMMLHALGLMHEHHRGDVLEFVSLHPRLRTLARAKDRLEYRIPQDDCSLFRQNTSALPFDFASIMLHDGSFQTNMAQMDFELPLIPKHSRDMRELLASRGTGLSHFDRLKLRHLYGCRSKNCPAARPCENFGFRNHLCQCECAPGYTGKHCELIRRPDEDPCLYTVKQTSSFALNATNCHPESKKPFNFTIELTGGKSNRFVVTVDMRPIRTVLETLRLLPTCAHARLYFTGTGKAIPQVVCAERLALSPVTLRTTYSSGMLLLMLSLPSTPLDPGQPDSAIAAIGAINVDISSESNPGEELQVNTHKSPSFSTTSKTTASQLTTAGKVTTKHSSPAPTSPTTRRPTTRPTKRLRMPVMPKLALGMAQKADSSSSVTTAIVLTVVIIVVLGATVFLAIRMLRFRNKPDEEIEDLQASQAGEESAALYAAG